MKKEADVREWVAPDEREFRLAAALRLGLEADLALKFVASDVPLWRLRDLVERGCPPELAARILR